MQATKKLKNFASAFLFIPLWLFPILGYIFLRIIKPSNSKRILLIAQNKVAAEYQKAVSHSLAKERSFTLYTATEWFPNREIKSDELKRFALGNTVNTISILLCWWDAVIFTNHPHGLGRWFSPMIKKYYINHGIRTGKINNILNEDGVFSSTKIYDFPKRIRYKNFLLSNPDELKYVQRQHPLLANRATIIGSPMLDKILTLTPNRLKIKNELKVDEKITVHVSSTWGPHSLIAEHGYSIFDEIRSLQTEYNFLFSLHPRWDELSPKGLPSSTSILQTALDSGCRVDQGNCWMKFLAVADLSISDHTSLAIFHAILNRPLILSSGIARHVITGSPIHRLASVSLEFSKFDSLLDLLKRARSKDAIMHYPEITRTLKYNPGKSTLELLAFFRHELL